MPKAAPLDFPALNTLRFVLSAWVLGYHLLPIALSLFDLQPWLQRLLSHGYWAVDVFFVLSGFVITHRYGSAVTLYTRSGYRLFLYRRLARIYPLHLVTLLGLATLNGIALLAGYSLHAENYTLSRFLANLLLIQSWTLPAALSWNHPAWAISIEWLLYLLSPILLFVFYRTSCKQAFLRWLVILGLFVAVYANTHWSTHVSYAVLRGVCGFALGISLYNLYRFLKKPDIFKAFDHPLAQALGSLSFALYMVQYPIILLVKHVLPPERYLTHGYVYLTALISCIALTAWLAHRFIEEPTQRWINSKR